MSLILRDISAGRLSTAPQPNKGNGFRAAFDGPRRKSRTLEFAPSAPTIRLPVTALPSSNRAVTELLLSEQSIPLRRLLYFENEELTREGKLEGQVLVPEYLCLRQAEP